MQLPSLMMVFQEDTLLVQLALNLKAERRSVISQKPPQLNNKLEHTTSSNSLLAEDELIKLLYNR
jgi:hypothetical protein